MSARVAVHASGAARREAALSAAERGGARLFLVGARIETARAMAAELALRTGAVSDVESTTFDGLVARLARPSLAAEGRAIASTLALDTAAAEALAALAPTLPRMGPLRATPGLPRALGRTLDEIGAADLAASSLAPFDEELAAVAARVERTLASEGLVPRARALERAIAAVRGGALAGARVVFVDVPIPTRLASELARAIAEEAADVLFTVPRADARTLGALEGIAIAPLEPVAGTEAAAALAESLFEAERGAPSPAIEAVVARGPAAEAAEVVRRALAAVREGTPLHRIAVVLRQPELARAALEAAFRSAGIDLAQRRGARRPDPSGRALLALIACASEGLSARAFSAYLSFGVMPRTEHGAPPPPSADDARRAYDDEEDESEDDDAPEADAVRAPRRWERLLVDAAVIGGDPARWRRRLAGLSEELRRKQAEVERTGGESSGIARTLEELAALERFALPLLDDLAALPARATLAVHREHLAALATRALAQPARALAVLAELAPRGPSGEMLTLAELARVLAPRLGCLESRPRPNGVVLASPDELRGASFDVVLLPGLAERVFPARVPEDPLLADASRRALSPDLADAHARAENERTLLALAVGAAERRVVALASTESDEGRARVPSVYFVELLGRQLGRVASGADVAAVMARAVSSVGSPEEAARPSERTLAIARRLAALPHDEARGRANHVVDRNPILRSALLRAWRREQDRLGPADGLVQSRTHARAPLAAHDPAKRPYSATALESFAACPLRFHYKSVLRLEPREEPARLEQLDPLLRGSITHEAQFLTLVALRDGGLLPLSTDRLAPALETLASVLGPLRETWIDRLVPAIPHVFHAEVDAIEADLREWMTRLAAAPAWTPRFFELAFGLPGEDGRDAASRAEPAALDEGITLRGAIDLVEAHAETGALRATDHKTGSNYPIRGRGAFVVRGGQTLQPVLYALALSKLFPASAIEGGRLWYCTTKGGFEERTVPLDDDARSAARDVAKSVSEALAHGALPAVPLPGACTYCDYRAACGPAAERRAGRVPRAEVEKLLPGLSALRRRP